MAKRTAGSDLNHDNWDREDDPEEAGTFSKASEDDIKKRVIRVAKRRNPLSSFQSHEGKPTAFGEFSGFGNKTTGGTASATNIFGFLTNLTNKEVPKTNGISENQSENKGQETSSSSNKKLDEYYAKLKGLNESVTEWIKKHVTANPLINLQPIFKDYDKYIVELEKMKEEAKSATNSSKSVSFSFTSTTTTSVTTVQASTAPQFSFGTVATSRSPQKFSFGIPTTTVASSSSPSLASTITASSGSLGSTTGSKPFSFGNVTTSPNGKFSFTSTVVKPATDTPTTTDEPNEDMPPKVEFTPVIEKDHTFTIRCKVFVKNGDAFGDRGVGNLYLKPVPDTKKTQLIVRADTNLGNLLCNFILSEAVPLKRMGKKDVMLICLPTPDSKPPPVPILLRVKSPEDADELLKVLQKHQK